MVFVSGEQLTNQQSRLTAS